jgi:hypothetical protein
LESGLSSHEHRFPKTLFTLSQCRIVEDDNSRDLLSQLHMHIDQRDEVALMTVDISYEAPQAQGIVNVALYREYSSGIEFIFSHGKKYLYHV